MKSTHGHPAGELLHATVVVAVLPAGGDEEGRLTSLGVDEIDVESLVRR